MDTSSINLSNSALRPQNEKSLAQVKKNFLYNKKMVYPFDIFLYCSFIGISSQWK